MFNDLDPQHSALVDQLQRALDCVLDYAAEAALPRRPSWLSRLCCRTMLMLSGAVPQLIKTGQRLAKTATVSRQASSLQQPASCAAASCILLGTTQQTNSSKSHKFTASRFDACSAT